MKWYEVYINDDYAICIQSSKEPTKEDAYSYLKKYEENAKRYDFTIDDIKCIREIKEEDAYALYNMEYSRKKGVEITRPVVYTEKEMKSMIRANIFASIFLIGIIPLISNLKTMKNILMVQDLT